MTDDFEQVTVQRPPGDFERANSSLGIRMTLNLIPQYSPSINRRHHALI